MSSTPTPDSEPERRTFEPADAADMNGSGFDRQTLKDVWLIIGGTWTAGTLVRWRLLRDGTWAGHVLWYPGWAAWVRYDDETLTPRHSSRPPPYGPPAGHPGYPAWPGDPAGR